MPRATATGAIDANDLSTFVQENSDFEFEMNVLSALRAAGFRCEHSGVYSDPVTGKIRQFDIRAERLEDIRRLTLAVECKNVRHSGPLLVSTVPRTKAEAFHHVLYSESNGFRQESKVVLGLETPYRMGAAVGKRTDQVFRDKNGGLISDDSATFDKMNQAVNSCRDLVVKHGLVRNRITTAIVPLLVVPPERLWQVDYDAEGSKTSEPRLVPRSSLFLNHSWPIDNGMAGIVDFRLSHLEFVSLDALDGWFADAFGSDGFFPEPA